MLQLSRRFDAAISVRSPKLRQRAGWNLCAGAAAGDGLIVVCGGRLTRAGRLLPNLEFGLPSPERTSAPAAGADPALLQDASGSAPHGEDVFVIL